MSKFVFSLMVLSMVVSACSDSADDFFPQNAFGVQQGTKAQDEKVLASLDMNGEWTSQCIDSEFMFGDKKIVSLNIQGTTLSYSTQYLAEDCITEVHQQTLEGTINKEQALDANTNVFQFKIPQDANISALQYFSARKVDGVLYITNFHGFDSGSLDNTFYPLSAQ